MTDPERCPKCAGPLAGGSCPRCLLAAGLESGAPGGPATSAPSPEEMQKHFPGIEVQELLGQGGMGIVYRGRHKNLDRAVALKILLPEIAREAGFADRFTREARTLARLQHPHIVGVHDFGESDGLWYLVMEYVDGTNLRQVMQAGGLGPKEALAIVPQVCDALQYAHDQGIVHRDIKPENILVDRAGRVKIADFGLAKLLQRAPVDLNITRTGQVMGTLHYMAPEQYRAPEGVDHRADIFSLGVVFYEMLTGELPVGSFPRPSTRAGVDARLDAVVMRAIERERDQRYQKASEVRTAVDSIAAVKEPPAAPPPPKPAVDSRLSRMAIAGCLGVPASIAMAAIAASFSDDISAPAPMLFAGGLTLVTGFVLSVVAWIRIARSGGRLRGLGWAIPGTFLAPLFSCTGVPLLLLTFAAPGIHVSEGPDGTKVRMPFISVDDGPGGTRVRMPGLEVDEGPEGTRVKMPGIDIKEGPGDGMTRLRGKVEGGPPEMTSAHKVDVALALEREWMGWFAVDNGPNLQRFTRDDREAIEKMTPAEMDRERAAHRLGVPYLPPSFFVGRNVGAFQLARAVLSDDGERARVLRSDGKVILSYPAVDDEGRWRFALGPVEEVFVSGGSAGATPLGWGESLRATERFWASEGATHLRARFPGTDLADRASRFRPWAIALRSGTVPAGRLVLTDGSTTISLPIRGEGEGWSVPDRSVQHLDRAPLPEDRDGWLGPGEFEEWTWTPSVQGGPVGLTAEAKATILEAIEALRARGGLPVGMAGSAGTRIFCVVVSEDLQRGRVVLTKGKQTISTGIVRGSEGWVRENGGTEESAARPPDPDDLDGWLHK